MIELTYRYNCKPHTSTSVALFELVLSEAPGPLTLKPMKTSEEQRGDLKQKWKLWLQDKTKKISEQLAKAQDRDKSNYDTQLSKQAEVINVDEYGYLCVELKGLKEHHHKVAPVVERP